jgi:hypothetical protein
MITRLRFINFRSHVETEIPLQPINLFIGPVAAGKSNVFKGMVLIQNSVHRSVTELFPPGLGEFHWVRSRWANETDPIGFEVDLEGLPTFSNDRGRYTLKLADSPAGIYVLEETLQRQVFDEPWQWVFQRRQRKQSMGEYGEVDPYEPTILHKVWHQDSTIRSSAPGPRFAKEVARALSNFGYFHLEASALKSLGDGQPWDRIGYNGSRLPDFIAWGKSSAENVPLYEKIREEMRDILPELENIIVTQVQTERQGIALSFAGHRGYIAAPDLSDGTLFTLGLLCIIHGPKRPAVLCIEEPETGLHPRRLRWLFDHLMALAHPSAGEPPIQIVLSTHSPYFLNLFDNMQECVQIFEQRLGRTQVSPLATIQAERLHQEAELDEPIGHLWATGLYESL